MSLVVEQLNPAPKTIPPDRGAEWRVFEHRSTELAIQCQPVGGGSDIMWPAAIRHISAEKIGLVLERRFEPQTALSLFLPDPASDSPSSVFARVSEVETRGKGRWLLDCNFVTPLTDERLQTLLEVVDNLRRSSTRPVSSSANIVIEKAIVLGVLFQVRLGNCDPIRRAVTKLHVNGGWPLSTGQVMKVWLGSGPVNESAADVRVNGCYKQGSGWLVDCYFLGAPPEILLESLRTGVV
jgi:hypothetical protein